MNTRNDDGTDGCVGNVVVFEPEEFKALKPQFLEVPDAILQGYFTDAEILLWGTAFENKSTSPIPCKIRKALLYALVCHLATLSQQGADTGGMAGTVASATEGSTSISFTQRTASGSISDDWLNQTQCGEYAALLLKKWRQSPKLYTGNRGCPWL